MSIQGTILQHVAAIEAGASTPEIFCALSAILIRSGREQEAVDVCDLGLTVCADAFSILGNRAVALRGLGRLEEALQCCQKQRELRPFDPGLWHNMGNILGEVGRLQEAAEALRNACALNPDDAGAHYGLAVVLLLDGDYRDGFSEFEWRWKSVLLGQQRQFAQPLWDGLPLNGKRILLHAEQGAGDTIQFARYLPLVEKLGGRLILDIPPSLARLMSFMPGSRESGDFDVHCPLLSLPLLCGTNPIPSPASFVIPDAMQTAWAQRIASAKLKVALVWSGSIHFNGNHKRSMPFSMLLPLLEASSAQFFSFQVGPPAQEPNAASICDLAPSLTDYAETAAALSGMDLVITVDTSVAHLAASLGKPTWIMLPFVPDWRWQLHRADSPWYPSVRLFRQKRWGDYRTVVSEIIAALARF